MHLHVYQSRIEYPFPLLVTGQVKPHRADSPVSYEGDPEPIAKAAAR